jgi:hypothetical protein
MKQAAMLFENRYFWVRYYTNDLNTDKGEVGGSSPPRPTKTPRSFAVACFAFPADAIPELLTSVDR